MKVSHEVPRCLLEESINFNDYDYALVHMFDNDETYYNFFKQSLKKGRTVYLDNSVFELEEMFDHDHFAYYVEQLGKINSDNFYYIIPDSLEDKDKTIESFRKFRKNHKNLPGKIIGVVQGKTLNEIIDCYNFMNENCDIIAISFDYSWYEKIFFDNFPEKNKNSKINRYHAWMYGRQYLISYLDNNNILKNKPHHLLGCSLPQEFKAYDKYKNIISVDTSNPIVHALLGIKYNENGLESKKSIKLVELFNYDYDKIDKDILYYNIKKFKDFCK